MKFKLLSPHIVADRWCPAGAVLDPPPPGYTATPLMEGVDEEGRAAVDYAKRAVLGANRGSTGFIRRAASGWTTRRSRARWRRTSQSITSPENKEYL